MKKKFDEKIWKLNYYHLLPKDLQNKFLKMDNNELGNKLSNYFTFQEFIIVFSTATFLLSIIYNDIEYNLLSERKRFSIWSEDIDYNESYYTSDEFFQKTLIENKTLKEIWPEIILV